MKNNKVITRFSLPTAGRSFFKLSAEGGHRNCQLSTVHCQLKIDGLSFLKIFKFSLAFFGNICYNYYEKLYSARGNAYDV